MVEFLANLLSAILLPMGVSYADILVYLNASSTYLLVLAIGLVAAIVLMVLVHFLKKGWRWIARAEIVVAYLVVVAIMVNAVCYGPLKATISAYMNASTVELADDTVAQSLDTIQKIGEEGIVLLKNENDTLPLADDVSNVNVFGWAVTQPYIGGTGSSDTGAVAGVDILQSLEDAGYSYNQTLIDMYTDYCDERPTSDMFGQDMTLPEPTKDAYTDEIMEEAEAFSDTAIVVIARGGGENYDLPTDMKSVIDGNYNISEELSINPDTYPYTKVSYTNNGDYDDFDEGESYLQLSNTEEDLLSLVCDNFENVIVIVNASNAMQLGWLEEYDIDSALLVPAGGTVAFEGIGEILNGTVNPSGRTADTFVYDLLSTPTINHRGVNTYNNVEDVEQTVLKADSTFQGAISFVNYSEGIYTGYKYYETASDDGVIDYEAEVQFPFGYGLSYTTFEKSIDSFQDSGDEITLTVSVKNIGNVAGRDVVELYYTPPYTDGGIEKASVNLIDFAKTSELEPGGSELIYFSIAKENLASYDSSEIKVAGGGYILEAGDYTISVRSDSHTVCDEATFTVSSDIDYSTDKRDSDQVAATNRFDGTQGDFAVLSRAGGFANYEEACGTELDDSAYEMDDETLEALSANLVGIYDSTLYDDDADEMPTMGEDNGLTLADMAGLDYDDEAWEDLLDQMSWDDMAELINTGGWGTAEISSVGKVATSDSDGPAGLNNYMTGAYGTTYPSEVMVAQTWSKDVANEIGVSMGSEFAASENYGWYGPAVNIHRSAFSGRNFEYFSEDAVLSGYMASEEINGASQFGVYPYVKHLALNDQEDSRTAVLLTWADEQTIRENYLKSFEIAIKNYDGTALAVMSSYNLIGTQPASADNDLLNGVLRDEWGFEGMVISDYDGSYGYMISDSSIRNGNDLMLGFGSYPSNDLDRTSATLAIAMRKACKNILYTVANSGYYAGEAEIDTTNHMDELFNTINMYLIIALVVVEVLLIGGKVVSAVLKKRKNTVNTETK